MTVRNVDDRIKRGKGPASQTRLQIQSANLIKFLNNCDTKLHCCHLVNLFVHCGGNVEMQKVFNAQVSGKALHRTLRTELTNIHIIATILSCGNHIIAYFSSTISSQIQ